jgi:spore coat-associated protein N
MPLTARFRRVLLESSPRRLLASAGILLLAGAGLVGTGANFRSTTSNTGSVVTTGILRQSNTKSAQAILTVPNMGPGDTATGTLDIGNTGDLPAVQSVTGSGLVDTPSTAAFSAYLRLKVEDLGSPTCVSGCPVPVVLSNASLRDSIGSTDLGTYQPGEKHRYRFTVEYPDGAAGAENGYAGAKTSVDITWGARQ